MLVVSTVMTNSAPFMGSEDPFHVHNSPPLNPSVHTLFTKVDFSIILPPTPKCFKWCFFFIVDTTSFLHERFDLLDSSSPVLVEIF